MSTVSWTGIFPDGGERVIEPGGVIPVWRGLTVTFAPGCVWQIEETRKEEPEKKEIPVPADDLDEEEDQDTLDDIDILEDIDISEDTDAADDTDEADEEGQEEMTYGFGC